MLPREKLERTCFSRLGGSGARPCTLLISILELCKLSCVVVGSYESASFSFKFDLVCSGYSLRNWVNRFILSIFRLWFTCWAFYIFVDALSLTAYKMVYCFVVGLILSTCNPKTMLFSNDIVPLDEPFFAASCLNWILELTYLPPDLAALGEAMDVVMGF